MYSTAFEAISGYLYLTKQDEKIERNIRKMHKFEQKVTQYHCEFKLQ